MICQGPVTEKPKIEQFQKLLEFLSEWGKFGHQKFGPVHQRLIDKSPEYLKENAFYHRDCYKSICHSTNLEKFKTNLKRSREPVIPVEEEPENEREDTSPPASKILRSSVGVFDKSRCIICQEQSNETLHTVATKATGIRLLESAEITNNEPLLI